MRTAAKYLGGNLFDAMNLLGCEAHGQKQGWLLKRRAKALPRRSQFTILLTVASQRFSEESELNGLEIWV